MGRHIGCHTDRNTRRTVDHQQGHFGREHHRFFQCFIKVRTEIYRIFFDIRHHLIGDLHHTGLRITHSSRGVSIDRTEVTLAIDQRIAEAPLLCHTHHGIIDRQVTMGVELTEHVTDDTG